MRLRVAVLAVAPGAPQIYEVNMINTKFDYDYLKDNSSEEFKQEAVKLLEGRFAVINGELGEDANAPLFRLGLTVEQVQNDSGISGLTAREIEWMESQPDRYQLVDGEWAEIEGWEDARALAEAAKLKQEKFGAFQRAVTAYLDSEAHKKGYDNIINAALRSGFSGPYHDEGVAFAVWMDACWKKCYDELARLEQGLRTEPSIDEFLSELPVLVLP